MPLNFKITENSGDFELVKIISHLIDKTKFIPKLKITPKLF